ncbi:MAG: glutaredoxin 3 [Hyphomicrobiales bacterium]
MVKATIYTKQTCPFCHAAKALLQDKGLVYEEIDITGDESGRVAMIERAGGCHTVPQIFIAQSHIGGFDDLRALNDAGKLDALLAGKGEPLS